MKHLTAAVTVAYYVKSKPHRVLQVVAVLRSVDPVQGSDSTVTSLLCWWFPKENKLGAGLSQRHDTTVKRLPNEIAYSASFAVDRSSDQILNHRTSITEEPPLA